MVVEEKNDRISIRIVNRRPQLSRQSAGNATHSRAILCDPGSADGSLESTHSTH